MINIITYLTLLYSISENKNPVTKAPAPTKEIQTPKPTTVQTTVSLIPSCRPSQYVCRNKKCVDSSKRCNGENDCGDDSDERICQGNA